MRRSDTTTDSTGRSPNVAGRRLLADQPRVVTALFTDRDEAERAYRTLLERGFEREDIDVIMSEETRTRYFPPGSTAARETELGTKAAEGAGVGGAIGGTLGALTAAIAAVGTSIAIPGLGIAIAGPLAAALAGAGAGAATGGLIGALVGAGIPEERVKHYETGIRRGGILLGVRPRTDEEARYLESEWARGRHHGHA